MGRLTILTLALIAWGLPCRGDERRYDVVVYGGTAGGVVSAVAAIRDGAGAVVLEPGEPLQRRLAEAGQRLWLKDLTP